MNAELFQFPVNLLSLLFLKELYLSVIELYNELRHVKRNPTFYICANKVADQLISAFVFTTKIEQSL